MRFRLFREPSLLVADPVSAAAASASGPSSGEEPLLQLRHWFGPAGFVCGWLEEALSFSD
jgi:hypothetical protein